MARRRPAYLDDRGRRPTDDLAILHAVSLWLTAALFACVPTVAAAQAPVGDSITLSGEPAGSPSGPEAARVRPSVSIDRSVAEPLIDGSLDDEAWVSSARITHFVQRSPREGMPATEDTEVLLSYDSDHLFVGVRVSYSSPSLIRANRSRRDEIGQDDAVSILLDPFLDQQRAYVFSVNGYGVQGDSLLGGGGGGGRGRGGGGGGGGGLGDPSWDALFAAAGMLTDAGWTAEMAIPFKSLRYPARGDEESHRWGLQVQRTIQSKDETAVWSPVYRDEASFLGQMGTLEGLRSLSISRNLEFLPTLTGVSSASLDDETGVWSRLGQPDAGLNVKYGVTSNMTLDLTVNPDFSQIESDRPQIAVNQRFPLFFREQRPFFLEGQEIFNVSGPATFIHTRTIVDPDWGTKLSGKVGRTSFGVLAANDAAPGRTDDASDPAFGQSARFLIGRVRYDVYSESSIGAVFTSRELLDMHSRVGGLDGRFRLGSTHRLDAMLVFSDHRDEAGVRRSGNIYDISFSREGRGLTYSASTSGIDPGFRTDVGFVRRTDIRRSNAEVGYRWYPETWLLNWRPSVDYSRIHDYDGVLQDETFEGGVSLQFARNIGLSVSASRELERFNGAVFRKSGYRVFGNVNTSRLVSIRLGFSGGDQIRYVDSPFLGYGSGLDFSLTVRPFSRLESQLSMDTSRFTDVRTDDQVYDVKIFRATTNYQFTERLSLRSILEHDTFDRTLGANLLATYRVNAGTVFFMGYDDRYRQGDRLNELLFPTRRYQRLNRAFIVKLQYLFRL